MMRTVEDGRICRWQFGINEAIFRETRVIVEQCLFAGEGASDRTNPLIFQARSLAGQENIKQVVPSKTCGVRSTLTQVDDLRKKTGARHTT
jgi:hypothetical protein